MDIRPSNIKNNPPNRRRFLVGLAQGSLIATVAVAIGQIIRFLSFEPSNEDATTVPVGQPTDYPPDTLTYVAEARAYVGHDVGGLYILDAVCPHLGCLVERDKDSGFACPCHGSCFDDAGQVRTGPATKPLHHFHLWLDQDGQLVIDRAQPVESTARLVV